MNDILRIARLKIALQRAFLGRAILMNEVLRIARLKIALQRAFLGRAILIFTQSTIVTLAR